MAWIRRFGVSFLGLAALALGGCAGGAADETPSLADVKRFQSYRVYYAGEEIAGQPLEPFVAEEAPPDSRATVWFFLYGHCEADEFPEGEGGCGPPLQIHNYSVCARRAGFAGARRILHIRGAKVAEGLLGELEFSTGTTTITIGAAERTLALDALRSLRPVRGTAPGRLPPPVPGALEGTLPCQHVPRKQLTSRRAPQRSQVRTIALAKPTP